MAPVNTHEEERRPGKGQDIRGYGRKERVAELETPSLKPEKRMAVAIVP
jgi:hypothetical protein